jgi:hypothetical protein
VEVDPEDADYKGSAQRVTIVICSGETHSAVGGPCGMDFDLTVSLPHNAGLSSRLKAPGRLGDFARVAPG